MLSALADLIAEITDAARMRRSLLIAEGDMTRRIKSLERSAAVFRHRAKGIELPARKFPPVTSDDVALIAKQYPAFYSCMAAIAEQRKATEKHLLALAEGLPCQAIVASTRGFGLLSLAAIIGECGDLSKYASKSKVWKRMGLAVFEGRAQRRVAGDPEAAARQGYSPVRRSMMFLVGDNLIRAGNEEYRPVYDARKALETARDPKIKPIIAHRRAKRYIEKRLLKKLWQAWRREVGALMPEGAKPVLPPAAVTEVAHV